MQYIVIVNIDVHKMDGCKRTSDNTNSGGHEKMRNRKIKIAMTEEGLRQWEVARLMGIHEGSLSRRLRNELPADEQDKIVELIRQHTNRGGGEAK